MFLIDLSYDIPQYEVDARKVLVGKVPQQYFFRDFERGVIPVILLFFS